LLGDAFAAHGMKHELARLLDFYTGLARATVTDVQRQGSCGTGGHRGRPTPARLEITALAENSVPGEPTMRLHTHVYVGRTAVGARAGGAVHGRCRTSSSRRGSSLASALHEAGRPEHPGTRARLGTASRSQLERRRDRRPGLCRLVTARSTCRGYLADVGPDATIIRQEIFGRVARSSFSTTRAMR
jgi:hypothetical protein